MVNPSFIDQASVLITDDNSFNQFALQTLLQQFNLSGDLASNGFEAIEMIEARLKSDFPMYSLILMDYSMPDMDGLTCSAQIRELLRN